MTDRELLELAAKVGSVTFLGFTKAGAVRTKFDTTDGTPWNPLADDGDALRLAGALRLSIYQYEWGVEARNNMAGDICEAEPSNFAGHYAATRRAIVRAAAEIGKAMP